MISSRSLQIGLESVSDYQADELELFKHKAPSSPLGKPVESALENNFQLQPIDTHLVDLAKPTHLYSEWLQPQRYQSTLQKVMHKLNAMPSADCQAAGQLLSQGAEYQHHLALFAGLLLKA